MTSASSTLYVVCGAPGSGKTIYAGKLAQRENAVIVDIDTATEPLVRAAMKALGRSPDDRDSDFYKKTFRAPVYEVLFAIALQNLPLRSVVIVGPFTREIARPEWLSELQARFGNQSEVHFTWCNEAERLQRLRSRDNPRDRAKFAQWENLKSYYAATDLPFPHVKIDTSS